MIYFTTALYMRTNKNPRGIKTVCFGYLIIPHRGPPSCKNYSKEVPIGQSSSEIGFMRSHFWENFLYESDT
jgi:hypothetical protein